MNPNLVPSKDELIVFATLLIGEDKFVSGSDQAPLKSNNGSGVVAGMVKSRTAEANVPAGDWEDFFSVATSEDGDDHVELVSHEPSDACGELLLPGRHAEEE